MGGLRARLALDLLISFGAFAFPGRSKLQTNKTTTTTTTKSEIQEHNEKSPLKEAKRISTNVKRGDKRRH